MKRTGPKHEADMVNACKHGLIENVISLLNKHWTFGSRGMIAFRYAVLHKHVDIVELLHKDPRFFETPVCHGFALTAAKKTGMKKLIDLVVIYNAGNSCV